ncbi:unnamed protein product [Spirodela intermedia]|uniref:Uncharacterized protein n=1 Tax=Spirodela intermedia TaxID=51605 RepID=A0A7I8JT56_SPIIN|nr:unnamed protein product [Spirodela intermedia]CAA6672793.1 unnamed protein product [Spirodela intermedia]
MAKEIPELDYWRKFFRCATPDIFHVIDQAIRVAAADSPQSFVLSRCDEPTRNGLPEKKVDLDRVGREKQIKAGSNGGAREAGEAVTDPTKTETRSQIIRDILKITETLLQDKALMTTDDAAEMAVRDKVENSKRKLHAGYQKASDAKKMRMVRIVSLKDAPKSGPDPKGPRRWRWSVFRGVTSTAGLLFFSASSSDFRNVCSREPDDCCFISCDLMHWSGLRLIHVKFSANLSRRENADFFVISPPPSAGILMVSISSMNPPNALRQWLF